VQRPLADPVGLKLALGDEHQAEHHEGKRGAVVEARLTGQAVAQAVAVAGVVDLHQARQHRIGGRQDRPDQYRDTPAQTEQVVAEQGDAADAGEHHRPGQYIGALPCRMP